MTIASKYSDPATKPPLDESFYRLPHEEFEFFRSQTGIEDEEEMKRHIITVQKKAYEIFGYPCIRFFSFTTLKISRLPAYRSALNLVNEHPDAILMDIGCCSGNDIRKAVADGWPVHNTVASDIQQGFWDFGHELFRSTPETFPATFIVGDAFDSSIIKPQDPFIEAPQTPRPNLQTLASLIPLQGHVSAIHASSFFHLFSERYQFELAKRVATLLSPLHGSVIFGSHVGLPEKGVMPERENDEPRLFCHSPESWRDLWSGEVFEKGTVQVEATLAPVERLLLGHASSGRTY